MLAQNYLLWRGSFILSKYYNVAGVFFRTFVLLAFGWQGKPWTLRGGGAF